MPSLLPSRSARKPALKPAGRPSEPEAVMYEPICKYAVRWLLDNAMSEVGEEWKEDVTRILLKTMRSFDGDDRAKVEYRRKIFSPAGEGFGRRYSDGAGFQMMWAKFRGALAHYPVRVLKIMLFDIDMKNAHPQLFNHDNFTNRMASAPAMFHSNFCPINLRW
eukprot:jgi/Tetstr1/426450/TSEL_016751.t1